MLDAAEVVGSVTAERRRAAAGLVPAEEAHLAGAQAFRRVPGLHLADRVRESAGRRRGTPLPSGSRSKVRPGGSRSSRSSMRSMRASWRRRTVSCLRTSSEVATGRLEKFSGQTRMVSSATASGGSPRLGERVAEGEHVDGGLDRGGGHLAAVRLAVDDRERLDLDDMEPAVQLERDQVRFQEGSDGRRPQGASSGWSNIVPLAASAVTALASRRPGPGVPQVRAGVAADLAEIVVVRLRDRQVQVLAEQREQFGAPRRTSPGPRTRFPGRARTWTGRTAPGIPRRRRSAACPRRPRP